MSLSSNNPDWAKIYRSMEETAKQKREGTYIKIKDIEPMSWEDIDTEFKVPLEKLIEAMKDAIYDDAGNSDWCCKESTDAAEVNIRKAFALGYWFYSQDSSNDDS